MKLLSIAVPSYNSGKFLAETLTSLLGYEDVEVIVVNDGSKDNTLEIAKEFEAKYPDYFKVIDKENGGHGSGLNAAYKIAEGLYFKCCDSDDTLDREGLLHLLNKIKELKAENNLPDVFMADYIAVYSNHDKETVCGIKKYFKVEQLSHYEDMKMLPFTTYLMIHTFFVKTEILKNNNMALVEKTFYEDNEFVYFVIGHSDTFYYSDKPIYRYALGDAGQSISIPNMQKNFMHDMRAYKASFRHFTSEDYAKWSKAKRRYVMKDLSQKYVLAYTYAFLKRGKERREAFRELKKECKSFDKKLFRKIRWKFLPILATLLPVFIRPPLVRFATIKVSKMKGWNY
ncbi:MAG: glycosyltransferase family 2 protein [Bacilli bacterium]|nr:glycosyltransferase family 2 protein [Bacilli bacterium]